MKEEHLKNLEELACVLDVADDFHAMNGEEGYAQTRFVHPCGTPACALGHWVAHKYPKKVNHLKDARQLGTIIVDICEKDFGIAQWAYSTWLKLFGPDGCKGAKTSIQAAAYIREFVTEKRATMKLTENSPRTNQEPATCTTSECTTV